MRSLHRLAFAAMAFTLCLQTVRAQQPRHPVPGAMPEGAVYASNGLPIGVPETTGGIYGEPLQRYDAQYPWLHGYFQEIPPYSGYAAFRPYNYKHVLAQSQAAAGWGESPTMPYAQQFWHRYRRRARQLPDPAVSETQTGGPSLSSRSRYSYDRSPRIIPAGGVR